MTFQDFLVNKCHEEAMIKVIWPERNRIATGKPDDFKNEMAMISARVFDLMITGHNNTNYDVIVWLTKTDQTMI